ncbi:hypothetical protein RchiOBHm_Chr6g0296051 [Rosa chinensis]|uniref:Uncharacterized protein n=1 Tax=Rosa chinensis TaxID=74649 RepID=A0A2P6PXB2_ROSCH|nr:hypothetical protein RchiOBHm_Chr6g0296051 [Rosa chinensis]
MIISSFSSLSRARHTRSFSFGHQSDADTQPLFTPQKPAISIHTYIFLSLLTLQGRTTWL